MLQKARLISLFCLVFLIQPMLFSSTQVEAAGKKKLKITVDKNYFLLKPGETATVDIKVKKRNPSDKIDLSVMASPLQIRTTEEINNANAMIHHATMQITIPDTSELKSYNVVLSASNGRRISEQLNLTFNVGEEAPSPDFNIISASFLFPSGDQQAALFVGGTGFGQTPRVIVNGLEITSKIISVQGNFIVLQAATQAELNLIGSKNEIMVDLNGRVTNRFILNLNPEGLPTD
jgi:hypothetical protein